MNQEFQDKEIKCVGDCGGNFVFTAGEQEFYSDKGMTEPKRCKECRAKKRAFFDNKEKAGNNRRPARQGDGDTFNDRQEY